MHFDIIVNVLFMIFLFAHSPYGTLFSDDSMVDLHDSTHRKNMIVHNCPYLFRYMCWPKCSDEFGHRFCFHAGYPLAFNSCFRCYRVVLFSDVL